MAKQTLGEFEHHVMLAAIRIGEADAYSVTIVHELERVTGRDASPAAVYIALRRLEEAGLVRTRMRRPEHEAGKPRRYVRVMPRGLALLRESRRRYVRLWDGLEPILGEARA